MWELGCITHRSARRRGYLVGPFSSVYEHRIPYSQSIAPQGSQWSQTAHQKGERGVNSQGALPIGKSPCFSCPSTR